MVWEASAEFSEVSAVASGEVGGARFFWVAKRIFDICGAVFLLPVLAVYVVLLSVLNPFLNQGSLFFVQIRMGRGCRPFKAYKFRTMRAVEVIERGADDPIEHDRITPFGRFLRKTRIDELPQAFNVLRGDMSLIGPRPDYINHARVYLRQIPEYRHRYEVRPGISGYSQVNLGYAVGTEATRQKARADIHYIRNAGFAMDAGLVAKTVSTILLRAGE